MEVEDKTVFIQDAFLNVTYEVEMLPQLLLFA